MIPGAFPRTLAISFLRFAIWIAPRDTHDWGHAMLSELNHVEGNWSALIWAFGGAGVLAKHAMLAVILPGSHRRTVSSAGELFAKEPTMRKTTLAVIASCVVASLLFFLVPVFRQAFHVSLAQWHEVLHANQRWSGQGPDPELEAFAKKADQSHDAEALAFVAVRLSNPSEHTRLAEEAVRLNSNLTWILAVVAAQWPGSTETQRWIPQLQKWDPQNALPHLLAAEEIDLATAAAGSVAIRGEDKSIAWQNAMAAAFQSKKLDSYSDRLTELDRSVLFRYHIQDPFEAITDRWFYGLPGYGAWDSSRYAKVLLESGHALEAQGDVVGAAEKYLQIARFGQLLRPEGGYFFLGRDTEEACRRLAAISRRKGDGAETAFYASFADQLEKTDERDLSLRRSQYFGGDLDHWNALIARASGLTLLFCALLFLTCALGLLVRGRSLKPSSFVASPLTVGVGLVSALGTLLSSVMLYLSYRPYSEILRRFTASGDKGQIPELSRYLEDMQLPIGSEGYLGASEAAFQFWCAVTLLCALTILIAVFRHFQTRPRASVSA